MRRCGPVAGGKHLYGMPKGRYIFGTAKVGEKGQIVIPKEARQVFGIEPGDTLLILGDERNGVIVSKPDVLHEAANQIFARMEELDGDD
jgi:AbrB family looped-hinge helix DNA binding protein